MSFQAQGMRSWLLQRLTAVYIAVYASSVIVWFAVNLPINYDAWLSLLSHPVVLVATVLFYLSLFVHAWVGIRDILFDYIKPVGLRFILLTSLAFFLIVMTLWLFIIFVSLVKV